MVATPYSYRQYAGNGSNRDFAVPFPFLVRANVGVYFGLNVTTGAYTTKLVDGTDYTWTNDTSIRTTTAPAVGVTLSVMRTTPSSNLAVQWQDGSTLIAEDLLTSDRQNLYVVQENTDLTDLSSALSQASSTTANTALTNSTAAQAAAAAATTTANTASTNASAAVATANTASTNATAAVTTANTAGTNASAAVTTANTANTNASAAVSTANTASSTAATALSTANSATTAAAAATSTANTASGNASAAVSTANTASTNATAAVSTANTANTNASAAVSTANTASTNASTAVSTANSTTTTANNALTFATAANTKSDTAIAAVAASVAYTPVANVAAIPGSPANDTYISVTNTTGLQSFTPLSGIPAGFAGDAGLTARLVYKTATTSWVWIDYYANNADSRYLKTSGGTMTGALVLSGAPTSGLHPATKTYVDSADTTLTAAAAAAQSTANTGVTNAAAAQTTANTGVTNAAAAQSTANTAVTNAAAAQSTANTAVTNAAAAQSTANTAVTNAAAAQATANTGVTNAAAAQSTANTANTTANAALPKAGGTMTGAIVFAGAQATATTAAAGIVQLTDSTASTSTTTAATPNSVKSAADLASAAGTTANAALPKAGGTMTGGITFAAGQTLPGAGTTGTAPILVSGGTTAPVVSADIATQAEAQAGTAINKLMNPLRTAEAIAALGVAASSILYNRRPALHRGPLFTKTAATTLSVVAGAVLNGKLYASATAVTMGTHTNNTDMAIWQHPTTGALVSDASFTAAPAGATGGSIVAGYHYIPSGRPTAFNSGSPTATAEILEYSIWDLTWRPECPDPRGMANIDGRFWSDLYLCGKTSYAGTTFSAVPSSKIGLTIADNSDPALIPSFYGGNGSTAYTLTGGNNPGSWYNFAEVAHSFGKRFMWSWEFQAAAFGAPEAGSRGTDPGTVIWERQSKWGLAQATGTLVVWGAERVGIYTSGSNANTGGRGSEYADTPRAVILGGDWAYGGASGSRCAPWLAVPSSGNTSIGARFAAGHLTLG